MFGKPHWFRAKTCGWGVKPVTWQGWFYVAAWTGVIALPFLMLLVHHLAPEAALWLAVTIGAMTWDVRQILRRSAVAQRPDIEFLDDVEPSGSHVATRNLDLRVKG